MKLVYLGLGSNLGDRQANLDQAMERLQQEGVIILRRSSLYETEPRDFLDQPWFLNMVVEVETRLFPRRLLAAIQRIESSMGRRRVIAKGPRLIDIDILFYQRCIINLENLTIPHPGISERRFVLEPLAELAPDLLYPGTKEQVSSLLLRVQSQPVRRFLVK